MKQTFFTILIIILLPISSWASFDSAMTSYERKDYSSASSEFKNLAAQNDSDAQYMLGYMYAVGKGVLQDHIEAHKWFNIAASHGNSEAVKARKEVERKMTREQISLAQAKARNWTPGTHKAPALSTNNAKSQTEIKDKNSIRQVQKELAILGYKPGTADGAIGNNTRRAIRQYQYDNNLTENGKVTQSLMDSLFPDGLPVRTVKTKTKIKSAQGSLLFPEIWTNTGRSVDGADNDQLIEQLTALLEKGRQSRAAQSWFLNDLSELIGPNRTAWSDVLLSDNFHDGDFTFSPQWTVLSGSFTVNEQGLYSQMTGAQTQNTDNQEPASQDLSTAILGAIFAHAEKANKATETDTTAPGFAKIVTSQKIPASFALKAQLSLHSGTGRIEFGPYTGNQQEEGYQLLISPEQEQIELLRVNSHSSSVIESKRKSFSLNQEHTIEWLRDEAGMITVAMDGKQLFQVTDRRYKDNFSGFMLNNYSASLTLREITVVGRK